MRIIDADKLKAVLRSNCKPELCHDINTAWCDSCCRTNDFEDLIDNAPTIEPEELSKIKEIVERALRSEDAINQYKAKSLEEIAEILGIEIKEPEATEPDNKDQITIDDIIKEV